MFLVMVNIHDASQSNLLKFVFKISMKGRIYLHMLSLCNKLAERKIVGFKISKNLSVHVGNCLLWSISHRIFGSHFAHLIIKNLEFFICDLLWCTLLHCAINLTSSPLNLLQNLPRFVTEQHNESRSLVAYAMAPLHGLIVVASCSV